MPIICSCQIRLNIGHKKHIKQWFHKRSNKYFNLKHIWYVFNIWNSKLLGIFYRIQTEFTTIYFKKIFFFNILKITQYVTKIKNTKLIPLRCDLSLVGIIHSSVYMYVQNPLLYKNCSMSNQVNMVLKYLQI